MHAPLSLACPLRPQDPSHLLACFGMLGRQRQDGQVLPMVPTILGAPPRKTCQYPVPDEPLDLCSHLPQAHAPLNLAAARHHRNCDEELPLWGQVVEQCRANPCAPGLLGRPCPEKTPSCPAMAGLISSGLQPCFVDFVIHQQRSAQVSNCNCRQTGGALLLRSSAGSAEMEPDDTSCNMHCGMTRENQSKCFHLPPGSTRPKPPLLEDQAPSSMTHHGHARALQSA
jgi:hypothetical protein